MKSILSRALLCLFLAGTAMAQVQQPPTALQSANPASSSEKESAPSPIRFDLDFKGGSVRGLIDAIGTARGKTVNVYVPQQADSIRIAPFKVTGVTTRELFDAISYADVKEVGKIESLRYHFFAAGGQGDSTFWSMSIVDPHEEQKLVCQVYSLSPYLESGLSVDDITTAIRTAWKMLSYTPTTVNLSYHRETKLLIAVVPYEEIQAIDQVLAALPKGSSGKKAAGPAPTEPPKSPAAKL